MIIPILICVYWIWVIDVLKSIYGNINTIVPSTGAVILLSWEQNQTWGILMTLVGSVCVMVSLIKYFQYKK